MFVSVTSAFTPLRETRLTYYYSVNIDTESNCISSWLDYVNMFTLAHIFGIWLASKKVFSFAEGNNGN